MTTKKRMRLDEILRARGFDAEADNAFVVVTEGRVFVDGQKAVSPGQMIDPNAEIRVRPGVRYVGRGAEKLEAALTAFGISAEGKVCADIGAATGGFTQVLLIRGAAKVYAIDTATGKLALKIRQDPRVVVMERTDIRDLAALPEIVDMAVADVSLISLRDILSHIRRIIKADGLAIVLFKPQYETRDPSILQHGVIRNENRREELFGEFREWLASHGWRVENRMLSPVVGGEGNREYLLALKIKN